MEHEEACIRGGFGCQRDTTAILGAVSADEEILNLCARAAQPSSNVSGRWLSPDDGAAHVPRIPVRGHGCRYLEDDDIEPSSSQESSSSEARGHAPMMMTSQARSNESSSSSSTLVCKSSMERPYQICTIHVASEQDRKSPGQRAEFVTPTQRGDSPSEARTEGRCQIAVAPASREPKELPGVQDAMLARYPALFAVIIVTGCASTPNSVESPPGPEDIADGSRLVTQPDNAQTPSTSDEHTLLERPLNLNNIVMVYDEISDAELAQATAFLDNIAGRRPPTYSLYGMPVPSPPRPVDRHSDRLRCYRCRLGLEAARRVDDAGDHAAASRAYEDLVFGADPRCPWRRHAAEMARLNALHAGDRERAEELQQRRDRRFRFRHIHLVTRTISSPLWDTGPCVRLWAEALNSYPVSP